MKLCYFSWPWKGKPSKSEQRKNKPLPFNRWIKYLKKLTVSGWCGTTWAGQKIFLHQNLQTSIWKKSHSSRLSTFRPLVARNQFVSQTRLEDFMERIQQNAPSFSFLQTNTYGNESTSFVEETIHNVSSTFHGNMINKILPSPQHADYIDLLEDRRPSYGTALQMFTMTDEKQNSEAKGYSSTEFWRSFLGSRYSSMNIKVQEMQKWTRKNSDPSPILIFYQIASYGKLNFLF